jgi:WD repeat-containing protein 26
MQKETWCTSSVRVMDLAISPDLSRLVVIGMYQPPQNEIGSPSGLDPSSGGVSMPPALPQPAPLPPSIPLPLQHTGRMMVYDYATRRIEA